MLAARPGQILAGEATRAPRRRVGAGERSEPLAVCAAGRTPSAPSRRRANAAAGRPARGTRPLVGRERELGDVRSTLLEQAARRPGNRADDHRRGGDRASRGCSTRSSRPRTSAARASCAAAARSVTAATRRTARGATLRGRAVRRDRASRSSRPLLGVRTRDGRAHARAARRGAARARRRRGPRAGSPLLLAFEDATGSTTPSRDLLERLARELPTLRVLLVLTDRSGEARAPAGCRAASRSRSGH